MRLDHDGSPWCSTHNPFDDGPGRALYVSPAGESAGSDISYRNLRLLALGPASVATDFPALGDGPLGLDAHVALAKSDDPLDWTLPEDYAAETFVINVRPHADGLELPTLCGWQLVRSDDGEAIAGVLGLVVAVTATKLDGGGVRIAFRYIANRAGHQPVTFELRDVGESLDTVSVSANSSHDYAVSVFGLDDASNYTFDIVAVTADGETQLAAVTVTGDDAGPDVTGTLTLTPK